MTEAVKVLDFETAAILRDELEALRKKTERAAKEEKKGKAAKTGKAMKAGKISKNSRA